MMQARGSIAVSFGFPLAGRGFHKMEKFKLLMIQNNFIWDLAENVLWSIKKKIRKGLGTESVWSVYRDIVGRVDVLMFTK